MPEGKYFYIKSELNGLVLDIEGGGSDPGTRIITWTQKFEDEDPSNQLWYEDHLAGVIRSKLNDLVLDVNDDDNIVIADYDSDRDQQQWLTSGDRVQSRSDSSRVLDIAEQNGDPGARIIPYEYHGGDNQKWSFEYTPARFFYIESKMHGKVLDIKKQNAEPGGKCIMMEREGDEVDHQLWYEDRHGVVCSKLNDFVLDSSHKDKIRLQPFESGNEKQLWTICGEKICNRAEPDRALDIKGESQEDGAKLLAYDYHGNANQTWNIVYL